MLSAVIFMNDVGQKIPSSLSLSLFHLVCGGLATGSDFASQQDKPVDDESTSWRDAHRRAA